MPVKVFHPPLGHRPTAPDIFFDDDLFAAAVDDVERLREARYELESLVS